MAGSTCSRTISPLELGVLQDISKVTRCQGNRSASLLSIKDAQCHRRLNYIHVVDAGLRVFHKRVRPFHKTPVNRRRGLAGSYFLPFDVFAQLSKSALKMDERLNRLYVPERLPGLEQVWQRIPDALWLSVSGRLILKGSAGCSRPVDTDEGLSADSALEIGVRRLGGCSVLKCVACPQFMPHALQMLTGCFFKMRFGDVYLLKSILVFCRTCRPKF